MKIPKKLKIGACEIEVKRADITESDADQNGGWFEWESNKMVIAYGMPEDREAVCFMHEVIHAANIYLAEDIVTPLAEILVQTIRDNNLDFRAGR